MDEPREPDAVGEQIGDFRRRVEGGRIVQSGPHDALMRSTDGLYRKLVERQFVQLQ